MPSDAIELAKEQKYFNDVWERREEIRSRTMAGGLAGNRADQRALNQQNRGYLETLASPDTEVAHGSITLDDGEVLYVGRNTIFDHNRDALVINWRSKIGELYERATVRDPLGVTKKRTFHTEVTNQIVDFDDTVFADLVDRVSELSDLQLSGVNDALLDDLDSGRTGAMRDIVKTIQASQSELIRHDPKSLLVVQGGPGTGKSAVALHRVSWLLFNEEGLKPDDVLVIGPTDTFTHYIKNVLPGLGDDSVAQLSLRRLGPITSSRRMETPEVTAVKGQTRMAGLIQRALHLRVRFAGNDPALIIGNSRPPVEIPRSDVERKLDELRNAPSYNAGRAQMRSWLADKVLLSEVRYGSRREAPDAQAIDVALNRIWPNLSPQQFLQELLGSRDRLLAAAGNSFGAGDIAELHRQAAPSMAAETWSDADIALLDEADFRINGLTKRYKHIVVDEAQDLSPMQLRSIRRRSTFGYYTIVGDLAQATSPWAHDSWDPIITALKQSAPVTTHELDFGYRVPAEIYETAAKLLPLIAPQLKPLTVVRNAPEPPKFIRDNGDHDLIDETIEAIQDHTIKGRYLGVIVAPEHHSDLANELKRRGISFADADSGSLGASINLVAATEAKGLEFDAVVVVEPDAIAGIDDRGLRLLYIALTRATKYLTVVHARAFDLLGLEGAEPLVPEVTNLQRVLDTSHEPPPSTAISATSTGGSSPTNLQGASQTPTSSTSPNRLIVAAASDIAVQLKEALPPAQWQVVLDEIARQLELNS